MTVTRRARIRTLAIASVLASAVAAVAAAPAGDAAPAAPAARRPKVCLVLAGGGAKGIAHVGVIKVLKELRVPVDCVVGTSMGSIVGASFASGYDATQIEAIVRGANWDRLLSDQPDRAERSVYVKGLERSHVGTAELGVTGADVQLPKGVLAGQQLQPFLRSAVRPGTDLRFDELPIPYRAVATDFETGEMVVLDHGDLSVAVRASMSVPGAFAPVDLDGRMLVDGGLVRNLPIDVAHVFHPDVVIAVDLGAPLLKRDKISSVLTVGLQTINILMAQNVARSIDDLRPADILIQPDVSDLESTDFAHSLRMIERGEVAARAVADRLAALSVGAEDYAAWESTHVAPAPSGQYAHVRLDTSALSRTNPASAEAIVAHQGADWTLSDRVDDLLATDDFERVDAHTEVDADGPTLVLRPIEKSWGPDYLRLGIKLGADLGGGSDFTIYADHRRTWLNPSGTELRLHASIGRTNAIAAEVRQPLDAAHAWFVDGKVSAENELRNLYYQEYPVAQYRLSQYIGDAEFGRRFRNLGEFAIGVRADNALAAYFSGLPLAVLGSERRTNTGVTIRFTSDTLDNLDFPQHGHLVNIEGERMAPAIGSSLRYDRVGVFGGEAFGAGPTSVYLSTLFETSAGTHLPVYRAFDLGGFLSLSGLREDQLLGERVTFLRAVLRQRVASVGTLLPGLYVGASLEAADVRDRVNPFAADLVDAPELPGIRVGAGSLFFSAQSLLGPFYLALGHSRGGQTSVYLYIGRP